MGIGTRSSVGDLVRTRAYRQVSGAWHAPAALACSGGVDSTALLLLAGEAFSRGKVGPLTVMHVDHGTRQGSESDARFVANLCRQLGLPFVALGLGDIALVPGRSDEDVWRERRYETLAIAMRRIGVDTLVTAHTRNDQVETILMRQLAGSARLGMQAEAPFPSGSTGLEVVRPLIETSRTELEDVLRIAGVFPLVDPSNVDTRFRRNAIRHDLIPVLERVAPGFDSALIRSAELHQRDADYCDLQAQDAFARTCALDDTGAVVTDRNGISMLHPAIATRVIRLAWREVGPEEQERELGFERLEAVRRALDGPSGTVIELPGGVKARIHREVVQFVRDGKGHLD